MNVEPEVVDFVPGSRADDPLFQDLIPESESSIEAHPEGGYDQRDSERALSLAGAMIDDEAIKDAERDAAVARGEKLLAVIYLPMDARTCGELLMAIGKIPGSHLRDDDSPDTELRIYGPA